MFILAGLVFISGCGLRQREIELNKKMNALNQKEQELVLKEQMLAVKEQQLDEQKKSIDSTTSVMSDSLYLEHQRISGTWLVDMQCIETSCPGSAVGDTKNEQWDFIFQGNTVIVTAMSREKLLRTYTGAFQGNILKLNVQRDSTDKIAKISVRLQQKSEKEMEGDREIIQSSGCHILYSLRMKKQ